jgi:hypothetical protein
MMSFILHGGYDDTMLKLIQGMLSNDNRRAFLPADSPGEDKG